MRLGSYQVPIQLRASPLPVHRAADGSPHAGHGLFRLGIGVGRRTKSFRADDHHRRLHVDVVGGRAAETADELACVLPSERAELSGKDDELSGER